MKACSFYEDGEHCFVPGVLRTVCAGGEPMFLHDQSSCCADDALVEAAKMCACGDTIRARGVRSGK